MSHRGSAGTPTGNRRHLFQRTGVPCSVWATFGSPRAPPPSVSSTAPLLFRVPCGSGEIERSVPAPARGQILLRRGQVPALSPRPMIRSASRVPRMTSRGACTREGIPTLRASAGGESPPLKTFPPVSEVRFLGPRSGRFQEILGRAYAILRENTSALVQYSTKRHGPGTNNATGHQLRLNALISLMAISNF